MKKTKKRLKNVMDWENENHYKEKPKGDSMTIQNDVLSIGEMLNRLTNGIPLTNRNGEYLLDDDDDSGHDEYDLEKVGHLDLVEHEELLAESREIMERFEAGKKISKPADKEDKPKAEKPLKEVEEDVEEEDTK